MISPVGGAYAARYDSGCSVAQAGFVTVTGPALPVETCMRRLICHGGFVRADSAGPSAVRRRGGPRRFPRGGHPDTPAHVVCDVSWYGDGTSSHQVVASEETVQALTGLMHIHGREVGVPRRLGLEMASVAAGLIAAQGLLAAEVGRLRDMPIVEVSTSVLEAGLTLMPHYIAQATCGQNATWRAARSGRVGGGPPFPTSDGRWVEIETLDPSAWKRFWLGLGVPGPLLGPGWRSFSHRYSTAVCDLPRDFRAATAVRTLADIASLARESRVAMSPVRSYGDVLDDDEILAAIQGPQGGPETAKTFDYRWTVRGSDTVTRRPRRSGGELPLARLMVVEATRRIQGPLAGQLLRLLGANVVRVEPVGGDFARGAPPLAAGTGSVFLALNRGKTPVELDLSRHPGRAQLRELLATADVFVHNWRPEKAAAWDAEFDQLAAVNPSLIVCHASAWGERAERCPQLGLDYLVQAYAGVGDGMNPVGENPFPSRTLVADVLGAFMAVEAVLKALCQREFTQRGARVTSSMLEGVMALQAHVLDAFQQDRECGRRRGRPVWGPLDVPLRAVDGYVVMSASDHRTRSRATERCSLPNTSEMKPQDSLLHWISRQPADAVAKRLVANGIPAAPVCTDLGALPSAELTVPFLQEIGGAFAPATPWSFR